MPGGIFCIESWSGRITNRSTVLPLLEFISQDSDVRFIHRNIETNAELHHYLSRFAGLDSYGVAYLAMHGSRGKVHAGGSTVALSQLGDWARLDDNRPPNDLRDSEWSTDFRGKVLYLGSCSTLQRQTARLQELKRQTGAAAICGYTRSVDWTESAAFELMLLPALASATQGERTTVARAIRRLRNRTGDLMDNLGFISEPEYR